MDNNTNPAPDATLTDKDVTAHTAAMWKYNPVPDRQGVPAAISPQSCVRCSLSKVGKQF